jgi:hypothetical protein
MELSIGKSSYYGYLRSYRPVRMNPYLINNRLLSRIMLLYIRPS